MFKHLLVPLDGSRLAEAALPAAAYLAQVLDATVTLIHIIERNAPKEVHNERHLTNSQDADAYLEEIARRAFPPTMKVERHVHTSEVDKIAPSIVEHTEEMQHDLVIMCTHGKGGLRDWFFGSIAQQVIGMKETPVFLIRPNEMVESQEYHCRKILVPVDRIAEHELGLPIAVELAQACRADLHILMVVPTFSTLSGEEKAASRLMPGAMTLALDMVEAEGEDYLRTIQLKFKQSGVSITLGIERGDPASMIVETSENMGVDLIVLGTHGRAGMDAFWSGSVAPKISGYSSIPLLLIPVAE